MSLTTHSLFIVYLLAHQIGLLIS